MRQRIRLETSEVKREEKQITEATEGQDNRLPVLSLPVTNI